jgi:hypothetical protein
MTGIDGTPDSFARDSHYQPAFVPSALR